MCLYYAQFMANRMQVLVDGLHKVVQCLEFGVYRVLLSDPKP